MADFPHRIGGAALIALFCCTVNGEAAGECVQPLCVNRADDDAKLPVSGMLRYAIAAAPDGAMITFDRTLSGRAIQLDRRSPWNHIKVERDVSIAGPGATLLTIDGGKGTRILFIAGGSVEISGLTLANGLAKGGDGGTGSGGGGGGGGAAAFGGAIFVNAGMLTLRDVVISGNRATGGNGGAGGSGFASGRGGGGGGFAGASYHGPIGGPAGDVAPNGDLEGSGGAGGGGEGAEYGGDGGFGGGGGGGGFSAYTAGGRGGPGGPGGFGGGAGGAGAFLDSDQGGATPAGGGSGGSALGGAIFLRSGLVHLHDTVFVENGASGGIGAAGAPSGVAKAGAIFICNSYFCGPGHEGAVLIFGNTSFRGSSARQAGEDPACDGRDDVDVCGKLWPGVSANESKR